MKKDYPKNTNVGSCAQSARIQPIATIDLCNSENDDNDIIQNRPPASIDQQGTSSQPPQMSTTSRPQTNVSDLGIIVAQLCQDVGSVLPSNGNIVTQASNVEVFVPTTTSQTVEPTYHVLTPVGSSRAEQNTSVLPGNALSLEFDPEQFDAAFANFDLDFSLREDDDLD